MTTNRKSRKTHEEISREYHIDQFGTMMAVEMISQATAQIQHMGVPFRTMVMAMEMGFRAYIESAMSASNDPDIHDNVDAEMGPEDIREFAKVVIQAMFNHIDEFDVKEHEKYVEAAKAMSESPDIRAMMAGVHSVSDIDKMIEDMINGVDDDDETAETKADPDDDSGMYA